MLSSFPPQHIKLLLTNTLISLVLVFEKHSFQLFPEDVSNYEILLSPPYLKDMSGGHTDDSLYYDQGPLGLQYPDYDLDLAETLEAVYDSIKSKHKTLNKLIK